MQCLDVVNPVADKYWAILNRFFLLSDSSPETHDNVEMQLCGYLHLGLGRLGNILPDT